jgi:hypothetical protein
VAAFTGKFFVLYAGREQTRETAGSENENVLATAVSLDQARQDSHWFRDGIWWEYEVLNGRILGGIPRWDIWVRRAPGSSRRA